MTDDPKKSGIDAVTNPGGESVQTNAATHPTVAPSPLAGKRPYVSPRLRHLSQQEGAEKTGIAPTSLEEALRGPPLRGYKMNRLPPNVKPGVPEGLLADVGSSISPDIFHGGSHGRRAVASVPTQPPGSSPPLTLHVLGIPHTITRKDFSTCAFTQKVVKLCAMMHRRGHRVIHYGVEGSDVECTEHVSIATQAEWSEFFAHPGTGFYDCNENGQNKPYLEQYKARLAVALRERVSTDPYTEIVCMTWGGPQRDAVFGIPQFEVETGIGYKHSWAKYRVYESYAWMHMHLGMDQKFDGHEWYWSVIPNSFDIADFEPPPGVKRGEDFLFLGRLNDDKGVGFAIHVAKMAGRKITIVGQGDPNAEHLHLKDNPHATYRPPVDTAGRAKLLHEAYAVFCPSIYVEPFCGVHVEAMICGAPVITSDWGVFNETVIHGVTGYRCRSFEHFVWAAKNVDKLERRATMDWARVNFSLERVALMYEEYFGGILNLKHAGFYTEHPKRTQLDWLVRALPETNKEVVNTDASGHAIYADYVSPIRLDIPFVTPDPPPREEPATEWDKAQKWERHWWGLTWDKHWDDEIRKQDGYFRLLAFPDDRNFGDKTVLDVGCGPVSMLQRSKHGPSRGIDPLAVSEETLNRYREHGIVFMNIKAEEMPIDVQWDEIWAYNLLQHTQDPHEILRRIVAQTKPGTHVRIFEWIDLGICDGHPQNLTEDMFLQHFGGIEWEREIWNVGFLRGFGGTVTEKYIAIVAVRKDIEIVEKRKTWRDVPGYFTFPDYYSWLAKKVTRPGAKIVEVGVQHGQSVAYLSEELDRNGADTSIVIDLVDAVMERVGSNLDYVQHRVGSRHAMFSIEAAGKYADGSVDALFIDAEHTYPAISSDLTAWLPKMRPGGIISGHDFCNEYPGVIQAVVERFPTFRVMRGSQWKDGAMVDAGGIYYCVWIVELP